MSAGPQQVVTGRDNKLRGKTENVFIVAGEIVSAAEEGMFGVDCAESLQVLQQTVWELQVVQTSKVQHRQLGDQFNLFNVDCL